MPKILAFDTATAACSVALSVNGEIYEQFHVAPQKHASLLLPMIQHLLDETRLTLADLDAIAFGQGPGSFMGIRIAAGVAQGLAFAAQKPVIAVPTLQALAQTAYNMSHVQHIIAGWDARMDAIYWGAYECDAEGLMQPMQPDRLDEPQDIKLPLITAWTAVGNAWEVYAEQLLLRTKNSFATIKPDIYPRAHALVRLAIQQWNQGNILKPEEALPVYLRDKVAAVPKS